MVQGYRSWPPTQTAPRLSRVGAWWLFFGAVRAEQALTLDKFHRETGAPLPNRIRPRPAKKDFQKARPEDLAPPGSRVIRS